MMPSPIESPRRLFAEEVARPEAEVHHWPDVGHYVMEDAPDRVIAALQGFLPRVEAAA